MRRTDVVLLLVVYVIPVGVAAVLLALADLGVLAVALVAVEAVVATSVYAVRQRPTEPARRLTEAPRAGENVPERCDGPAGCRTRKEHQ